MNFDQMSWGGAVDYVRAVGFIILMLQLSVPVGAAIAIRRGRRNRPGSRLLFPRFVLWACVTALGAAIVYFFSGAWYGENGPPPQTVAAQVTVQFLWALAAVAAIHGGLYFSTRPVDEPPGPG